MLPVPISGASTVAALAGLPDRFTASSGIQGINPLPLTHFGPEDCLTRDREAVVQLWHRGDEQPGRSKQVDAKMRSSLSRTLPMALRHGAPWADCAVRRSLPETAAPNIPFWSDTNGTAPSIGTDRIHPSRHRAGQRACFGGSSNKLRACTAKFAPPDRVRRITNENAHADRCAPRRRNARGGPQRQPY